MATKSSQANEAIQITDKTLNQYLNQGPNSNELNAAKSYLTGSFPLYLSSNEEIANVLIQMAFYHFPLDYLTTYRNKVNTVSKADVKKAFNDIIHPNQLLTISVGKP